MQNINTKLVLASVPLTKNRPDVPVARLCCLVESVITACARASVSCIVARLPFGSPSVQATVGLASPMRRRHSRGGPGQRVPLDLFKGLRRPFGERSSFRVFTRAFGARSLDEGQTNQRLQAGLAFRAAALFKGRCSVRKEWPPHVELRGLQPQKASSALQ